MKIRDRSTLDLFDSMRSNADRAPLAVWIDPDEPNGDSFAGGGGAKLGIANAFANRGLERRAQDVAVNHWPEALAMYAANHPNCRIFCEDVTLVDPVKASGGRRYALAWFSPTCIFFSQARGGPLDAEEATKVRGLAHVMIDWAKSDARPRVSCLENVKQFEQWGPLHRQHSGKCSVEAANNNGTTNRKGDVTPKCLKGCCYGRPIKARKGEFFRQFVAELRTCYRYVSWRVLKAHHYGAPTSRERFFLIASDKEVTWPTPTHGPGLKPYRTAAECIDFSIECPSIFERKTPLKPKTCARIVAGVHRFVFGAARPFIVPAQYGEKSGSVRVNSIDEPTPTICGARGGHALIEPLVMKAKTYGGGGNDAKPATEPLSTITTSKRGEHAIAVPYLIHRSNGERAATETTSAQLPRIYDIAKPLSTIVAGGIKHGLAMPVLIKNYSEREGGFAGGQPVDKPIGTITQRDHHSIAMLNLLKLRGTQERNIRSSGAPLDAPLPNIAAQGTHYAQVAAFLVRIAHGDVDASGKRRDHGSHSVEEPLPTLTTSNDFCVVTLTMSKEISDKALRVAKFLGYDKPIVLEIDGEQWILVDIGFRMLTPRELFLCQGFPPEYKIEVLFEGKPLTKTAQTKCVGNSVPPQLAEAVADAAIQTIEYEPGYARAA